MGEWRMSSGESRRTRPRKAAPKGSRKTAAPRRKIRASSSRTAAGAPKPAPSTAKKRSRRPARPAAKRATKAPARTAPRSTAPVLLRAVRPGPAAARAAAAALKRSAALKRLAPHRLDPAVVAAWRMFRQRLDAPMFRAPEDIAGGLARTGWLVSPSGSTPYLSLAARYPGFTRADLDRAVFIDGTLLELPTFRDLTVVVPVEDAWLALQGNTGRSRQRLDDFIRRRGLVRLADLRNLQDVVRAVLAGRPLTAETLAQKVPYRLVKDLGDVGRRAGLPTSLDLAVRDLVSSGDVVFLKTDRRLDRKRGEYALRLDLRGPAVTADVRPRPEEEYSTALAERYFRWLGPARLTDFAWWADLPLDRARQAARSVGLLPVEPAGLKGEWFLPEVLMEGMQNYRPPEPAAVAFVPFQDMLTSAWKTFEGMLDPHDLKRPLVGWTGKPVPAREAGPAGTHHHFIVIGGRVAGAWEHGPDGVLRYATFSGLAPELEKLLGQRATGLAEFVVRELGEARFYSGAEGPAGNLAAVAEGWGGRSSAVSPRSH